MSEKPISPLRQRMLEDMNMRRFVPDTQREYIRAVKRLAIFLGRSPDAATAEELRAFQLHLTETGAQPPSINATVTALRFFFKVTSTGRGRRAISCSSTNLASCRACSRPNRCSACWRPHPGPSTRRRSALPTALVCAPWRSSR